MAKARTRRRRRPRRPKSKTDKAGRPTPEALLEDPEIRMARDLVVWAPTPANARASSQDRRLRRPADRARTDPHHRRPAEAGIDWNPGPAPSGHRCSDAAHDPPHRQASNTIGAGESGTVTVTVTNEGTAPAFQVRAYSDSDYSYFDERELLLGRIDPGQMRSATLKLSVSEHELSRTDRIEWQVFEQHGATLAPGSQTQLDISSEGLPRPQFAYGYQLLDDPKLGANIRGNADGALQVGERVRMRVTFKNTGEGQAIDTWVTLRNLVGDAIFLHSGRENLKAVAPGEARVVEFDLEVKEGRPKTAWSSSSCPLPMPRSVRAWSRS
jgi:carboxyl-terminal processing protease